MKAIEIVVVVHSNQQFSIIEANSNVCKAVFTIEKVLSDSDSEYLKYIIALLDREVLDMVIAPLYKGGEITNDRELQLTVAQK